jgi:hypothetical protein
MNKRALLLIGSPGNLRSNSSQIGQYLLDRLVDAGWEVEKECICQSFRGEDKMRSVLGKMDNSDLIILSFPLYVDSLPSPMIRFLEMVNDHRKGVKGTDQRMMAVCQSGFPESHHNDCALRMCSVFARDAGFQWLGGLSVGGGGAIGGRDIKEGGGMLRNLRNALDMSANAMVGGMNVPQGAKELTNKGIAPPWLYNWIVNRKWKQDARNNGVDPKSKPHPLWSE